MQVNRHSRKLLYASCMLAALLFISSCKKQAPVCRGNCEPITANGKVINKLTNSSAADVPVSLSWTKFVGIASQREVIVTVNSKPDGTFNFKANIDTSYFSKGYSLTLGVGSSNDYMILGYSGIINASTYSFDRNAFQNKQFEVCRKANLTIRLHRTSADNFQGYSISHSNVVNDFFLHDYNVQSPQEVIDRNTGELQVFTVADVYTKIRTVKTFANGTSITTLDSLRCTANATSFYSVSF